MLSIVQHHRHLALPGVRVAVAGHTWKTIKLRFGSATVRAILAALHHRRRVTITLSVVMSAGRATRRYSTRIKLLM